MQIRFYDTRIIDYHSQLVQEKTVNYGIERLESPHLVVDMLNDVVHLNELGEEHCYMLAMNTSNRVIGMFFISKGTINQSLVGTRELYMRALLVGAAHIIISHNHPSGECTPSQSDILLTKRVKEAGVLLGIPLADHIIIGGDEYYSFRESEMI